MTDAGRARLRRSLEHHEAVRHKVYDDATGKPLKQGDTIKGHPTVGVGRNLAGKGLRDDEIAFCLENDLDECLLDLTESFTWFKGLNEARQGALAELRFMLGPARFRKFKRMITALGKGEFSIAGSEVEDSELPARRRAVLAKQLARGVWG